MNWLAKNPIEVARKLGIVIITLIPYLDAITDPLHTEGNTTTTKAIAVFLAIVLTTFLIAHISKPISYTIQSLKAFSPLVPLLLFGIAYWGAYFINPSAEGFGRCSRFTFLMLPYCVAFLTLIREPDEIELPIKVLFFGGVFLSLICLVFQTHTPFVFLSHGYDLSGMHRGAGRYNAFGTLASSATAIGLIRFCEGLKFDRKSLLYLLGAPIALAGAIVSGERASLVLIAVVTVVYLLHQFTVAENKARQLRRIQRQSVVLTLAVLIGGGVSMLGLAEFSREHWASGKAIEGRFDYQEGMYAVPFYTDISRDPIIGVGPANYFNKYGFRTNVSNYPHNMLLEIGGEMGAVGFVVYALIICTFFRGLMVARKLEARGIREGLYYSLCAVAFMFFLRTFKQGSIPRNIQFWLYWAYLAWLYEYHVKERIPPVVSAVSWVRRAEPLVAADAETRAGSSVHTP